MSRPYSRATLLSLAIRVTRQWRADRELDAAICLALQYVDGLPSARNVRPYNGSTELLGYDAGEDRDAWVPAPPLTASLDAVEALRRRFLPESQAHNKQSRLDGTWEAMVIDGERTIETSGITEAQARLAAILQAMAASPAR